MTHNFRRAGARGLSMFRLEWTGWILLAAMAAAGPVWAQAPAPDPSPLAPGDLKKPIFDTTTPVYNVADLQAKSATTVVAEVEGSAITLGEVADAIAELPASVRAQPFPELFPTIVDRLIRQQALVIQAQHQGLDEDAAVRRKMKEVSDRTLADEYLRRTILPTITEQALLERYQKDVAGKPGPEQVRARVIMLPTEDAAEAIIAELNAGADFATLARRSSQDATAPAGGDLGFVERDGLTPEIGAVAFAMQPGQFTPHPVRMAGAWFVVKVEQRRRGPTPTFFEARERLTDAMLREAAPGVAERALSAVKVRQYELTGKEEAAPDGK